jgi:hypothetical protein
VLDSGNAAVKKALTKAGVQLEQLKSKVGAHATVWECAFMWASRLLYLLRYVRKQQYYWHVTSK